MALDPVQKVRDKTSQDTTVLPDSKIQDYIDENTDTSGNWDFNLTVADILDYLASLFDNSVSVTKWTRGPTSVEMSQSLIDRAAYYRALAGVGVTKIVMGELERKDYDHPTVEYAVRLVADS
jgi:hypothetical protein